ncbi:unnamed protein product [Paramecium primaurelia]|uniref:Protein kinase domain-containing protein n=1 Tax=Paramecium primaurelia TaxID=5886 RepID=A0A8S1MIB9_PARPR|nr:unnamed protein product [Paramecium primaurelia]
MDKYKIGKVLGDGTFGSVYKAVDETTGQIVAIKKMKHKYNKWDECINLPEIKSLLKLHHPNIVKLYEIIKQNDELHFVFEFMERNVYHLMKDRQKPFNEIHIRNIIYQTLQGLAYMHKIGYFHRDLKPENLLESNGTIKIADFGLARDIRSSPPFTDYVSTRWYRAPEVILRSNEYNSPIDIFAIGCIMAELYRLWPLFPGTCDTDQLQKICEIMGTPSEQDWPDGYKLAAKIQHRFPKNIQPKPLSQVITQASDDALDLISQMLRYNPLKRPNASQALAHRYFIVALPILPSLDNIEQQQDQDYANFQQDEQQQDQRFGPQNQQNISLFYMKNARYKPGYTCILENAEDN